MHAYCPKHYKRGTLKIKTIKGHSYAYVHHWHLKQAIDCYLGQADKIDLKNHDVAKEKHGVKRP